MIDDKTTCKVWEFKYRYSDKIDKITTVFVIPQTRKEAEIHFKSAPWNKGKKLLSSTPIFKL